MSTVAVVSSNAQQSNYTINHHLESVSADLKHLINRIKSFLSDPMVQQALIGIGTGIVMALGSGFLVGRILNTEFAARIGLTTLAQDSAFKISLLDKIILAPIICVICPVIEEEFFRGHGLQEGFKRLFTRLLIDDCHLSAATAKKVALVASIVLTSLIFGLVHFTNAAFFWCNPIIFVPQVIAATVGGIALGILSEIGKETFEDGLTMPISAHLTNNTLAWTASFFV